MSNTTTTILVIISAAVVFLYTLPYFSDVQDVAERKERIQSVLENIDELEGLITDKREEYQEFSDQFSILKRAIPAERNDPLSLMTLNRIAEENNIEIDSGINITEGSERESAGRAAYHSKNIGIRFLASYDEFIGFLEDIERSVKIFDVVGIDFSRGDVGGEYEFSVELRTYWLDQ